jgi:superfamily II DNA or RNA helicase
VKEDSESASTVVRRGAYFEIRLSRTVTRIEDATAVELSNISTQIAAIQQEHAPLGARVDFVTGAAQPLMVRVTPIAEPTGLLALPGFVPGQEAPFVEVVRAGLAQANGSDLVVAFLLASGVREIEDDLADALSRGAEIRVLTGDYLGTTEPEGLAALLRLMDDSGRLKVKLYCCPKGQVFHAKAYLFIAGEGSAAYIGSSNLSRSARRAGIEWNLRAVEAQSEFAAITERFTRLWEHSNSRVLTPELLEEYRKRRPAQRPVFEPADQVEVPSPHSIQRDALRMLAEARAQGKRRGLVVLATGLGKTLLSAFDFEATGFHRALFVAHREEILAQARAAWGRVLPERSIGRWSAGRREHEAEVVFASIQALSREGALTEIGADLFDYVVIDEFHHAGASTYKELIERLKPKFLLGLTATPQRADGADLLALCDGNLVFEAGLRKGLAERLLVPFRYYGLMDGVDYEQIPWRSGRFDEEALTRAVATREYAERALAALDERTSREGRRVLVFCCSVAHADFMAEHMRSRGIAAAAVHSQPSSAPRAESLRKFKAGELTALTAVDLFNEGLDVPDIDAVLMLRPTESPVIFLQQIGRGLRVNREREKPYLTVVDVVGNHRAFLSKLDALRVLLEDGRGRVELLRALREGSLVMPEGSSIDLDTEAIEVLELLCFREFERASRPEALAALPPMLLKLTHNDRNPILMLDRKGRPDTPVGDTEVEVDGRVYLFRFVKIAVNVAVEPGSKKNVLPDILRRWFGADAGWGSDSAKLSRRARGWRLEPAARGRAPIRHGVPWYRDLVVACGVGSLTHGEPERLIVAIRSAVNVDPLRHFVVNASGDSMDGGDTPIRDGDLVLCELAEGVSPAEVANTAALLGLYDGPEVIEAMIKVPVYEGGRWLLRSTAPGVSDRIVPPGYELRVIAKVRGPVVLA